MTASAYERILDALRDHGNTVVTSGRRAKAQCPAHDDRKPSLSIAGTESRVLVHCHAGCDITDVLAELGLTLRDLYDQPRGDTLATYSYPGGRRVHRKADKTFPQSGNTKTDRSLFHIDRIGDAPVVFVVEGEEDVFAVESAGGVAVTSAMGAGNAHKADWSPLRGREVTIVPDRDKGGDGYAESVTGLLDGVAASVTVVRAAVGKDASDHIAAWLPLDELVPVSGEPDDAGGTPCTECGTPTGPENPQVNGCCTGCTGKTAFKATDNTERPIWPSPSSPLEVARELYKEHTTPNGLHTLLYWRGTWMLWQQTHWIELDPAALRSTVYDVLGNVDYLKPIRKSGEIVDYERTPWDPNKRKVCDVLEAMQAVGHLSANIDPPSWIYPNDAENIPASQIVSCTNGLLVLSTRTATPHTPALFNTVSVPFDHDNNAAEPKVWLNFLASIWPDDQDSVLLLQEYLGYVLSGRTDMQKLLLLIGPTRSGKGTIARMLTELVGRAHVVGPTLASLGTNFGLSPLLGKPLAIISDARLGAKPAHTVVERLLSITGEDMLTVDRKFREPWSGKLPTRFVVLSNELPRFSDSSGAIANRLLILQMTNSFLGREDRTLDDQLRQELPGILNWCLDGLDRLNRNGRFTVPGSSNDAATLMMDLASPVSAFVRDKCAREPNATVEADRLYAAWKVWAEDNGHRASSKSLFGKDLRAVVPELQVTQHTINNRRVRCYVGIALNAVLPVQPVQPSESAGQSPAADAPDSASPCADPVQKTENAAPDEPPLFDTPPLNGNGEVHRCGCGNRLLTAEAIRSGSCKPCRDKV